MGRHERKDCCYDRVVVVPGAPTRIGTIVPYSSNLNNVNEANSVSVLGFGYNASLQAVTLSPDGTTLTGNIISFVVPTNAKADNLFFKFRFRAGVATGEELTLTATLFVARTSGDNSATDTFSVPEFIRTDLTTTVTVASGTDLTNGMVSNFDKANKVTVNEGDMLAFVFQTAGQPFTNAIVNAGFRLL